MVTKLPPMTKTIVTEALCRGLVGVAEVLAKRASRPGLGDVEGAFAVIEREEQDAEIRATYRRDRMAVVTKSSPELRVMALDYLTLAHNVRVRVTTGKRPAREPKLPRCVLWVHDGAPFSEIEHLVHDLLGGPFGLDDVVYVVSPHQIDGMAVVDVVGAYAEEMFHLLDGDFTVWWANEGEETAREPRRCRCGQGCAVCKNTGIVPVHTGDGP